ncbi:MAG: ThiF family adenylyltransferase, partial [Pirellulales bacterium]
MFRLFNSHARFREMVLAAAVLHSTARLDVDQRFPRLIGLRESAGALFARRRVVVVGVGSVGRRIALHLARLGIEVLWLVDPDRYDDRVNLLVQEILATDLGHTKAGSTGKACKEISPATRVFA